MSAPSGSTVVYTSNPQPNVQDFNRLFQPDYAELGGINENDTFGHSYSLVYLIDEIGQYHKQLQYLFPDQPALKYCVLFSTGGSSFGAFTQVNWNTVTTTRFAALSPARRTAEPAPRSSITAMAPIETDASGRNLSQTKDSGLD